MVKIASVIALLITASTCNAFIPSAFTRNARVKQLSMVEGDTNFIGIDLSRLLGAKRLNNIKRKLRREKNVNAPKVESSKPKASTKKPLGIIIAGAPASGKGTQCEMIVDNYGVVHLSTGDMLRAAVTAGTAVGKAAKEFMDSGKLVPDDVIIGIVKDRLAESDCEKNGWLLDGFPRTPAQAEALAAAGVTADCFLFLNVPDEVLVERVVGRRTDPETGKIYHMTFSPPEDDDVKTRLVQRSDDTEEKVKVRLEQFHNNVAAVKGNYETISVEINGTQKPSEVAEAVSIALKEKCAL